MSVKRWSTPAEATGVRKCTCTHAVFLPEPKAKRGERIEKITTSKGLMHSNDHIKENWATIEGGSTLYPPLGESLHMYTYIITTLVLTRSSSSYMYLWDPPLRVRIMQAIHLPIYIAIGICLSLLLQLISFISLVYPVGRSDTEGTASTRWAMGFMFTDQLSATYTCILYMYIHMHTL